MLFLRGFCLCPPHEKMEFYAFCLFSGKGIGEKLNYACLNLSIKVEKIWKILKKHDFGYETWYAF